MADSQTHLSCRCIPFQAGQCPDALAIESCISTAKKQRWLQISSSREAEDKTGATSFHPLLDGYADLSQPVSLLIRAHILGQDSEYRLELMRAPGRSVRCLLQGHRCRWYLCLGDLPPSIWQRSPDSKTKHHGASRLSLMPPWCSIMQYRVRSLDLKTC